MAQNKEKESSGKGLSKSQPSLKVLIWSCVACIVLTIIIGFTLGGWVTGGTAQNMAEESAEKAVVDRLAAICIVQFKQDPEKDKKLEELKKTDSWERRDYVKKQGWATMPGEKEADSEVAEECAKLLMQSSH
ncbi:MAG TPA: hypothetical protein VMW42_06775 [Desulfatiglandales bacterium]|nr:hypothetical protein [Desulfatiglandales bacterium]